MGKDIEISRHDTDTDVRQEWRFWFYDSERTLYLDTYDVLERPTKRHKYRVSGHYQRCDQRNNSIAEDAVPLPAAVMQEAKDQFCQQVTVKKWGVR